MPLEAGDVYVAPADYHLLVEGDHFALDHGRAGALQPPSIDVTFELGGRRATAQRRSGSSSPAPTATARAGCAHRADRGGLAWCRTPQTAEAATMPQRRAARPCPAPECSRWTASPATWPS